LIMAELPAADVVAAARALMLAGRWRCAAALLDRAAPAGEGERAVLAVAAAEVAVDQDFWSRTGGGSAALARATAAVGDVGTGSEVSFDLEFIRLKHDYAAELFGDVRDPDKAAQLSSRAAALRDGAPDASRRANAAFYQGLVAELLLEDPSQGSAGYRGALELGQEAGDSLIESYALRHLGYHEAAHGDPARAREMLQRSMELRQRAGCVPHVLAQQLALAELAKQSGEAVWAGIVADQVRAWASAFGDTWLVPAAESISVS
jgi:tetratricopeptide (TPR) repeat protein